MASETPSAHDPTTSSTSTSWEPPRRRNVLNDASSLINGGGLGDPSSSRGAMPPPSKPSDIALALDMFEKQFYPLEPKSLSGIALRAFLLGLTLALSSILTIYLLSTSHPIWRFPFSLASLSLFHFLEFYTTALTNVPAASVSSFLLSSNGSAYMIAHLASMTECLLSHFLLPTSVLSPTTHYIILSLGLSLIILGQTIRALAMLKAGTNFSHFVRRHKAQSHELVTSGIYAWFRHPSYFGYFWWGIGTQLVYGNAVCLLAFGVVLWKFFSKRIEGEEKLLVKFFGGEYLAYRKKTWVGIPFIR
ncbi:ICMT-domain-containing protein [Mollisia scopiformis]|uniref:Protein-S-isoprenylcysteine O-methyltransferase n=1 Tax=Mollisia scopiformis TaxID=149040 RepID=A0A194XFX6_MOLSC|nr:ICMT-domain-containing protein [Mollisia scopiformis]KUJ19100.1 ICMT-domain-containing protein [Mollisia scopiformis]